MKLIVGLGNPGDKYRKTRHNLGFEVLDEYVKHEYGSASIWLSDPNLKSEILKEGDFIFAKPETFMNNSGLAVRILSTAFEIAPEDVIVIHDDLDLPLGKIKVRIGGSAGGHHGIESIIGALETDQFIRLRAGIGNLKTKSSEHKEAHVDTNKFVLEGFLHSEKSSVKRMIKQSVEALKFILDEGLTFAQNQFN